MATCDSRDAATVPRREWRVREADGEADAYFLQRLWHHWFGAEYDSNETLQIDLFDVAGWSPPEDAGRVPRESYGVIAEHRDGDHAVRIGGGIVSLLDHDDAVDELPEGRFDADALAGRANAWMLINAVDQAWRGEGIGSELLRRRQEWARAAGADMAIAMGWERDGRPTSRPLLERAGFVPVERIEEMYAETGRTACPDCGVWPSDDETCQCDATVWAKDIEPANE
jgi:GNAT superfamily N-acetyltransferase